MVNDKLVPDSVEQDITQNLLFQICVNRKKEKCSLLYLVFANQLCLSHNVIIDDALDEYLQMPSKKATPNQPSIKEEAEEVEPITTLPVGE